MFDACPFVVGFCFGGRDVPFCLGHGLPIDDKGTKVGLHCLEGTFLVVVVNHYIFSVLEFGSCIPAKSLTLCVSGSGLLHSFSSV